MAGALESLSVATLTALIVLGVCLSALVGLWHGGSIRAAAASAAIASASAWVAWGMVLVVLSPEIDSDVVLPTFGMAGVGAVIATLPVRGARSSIPLTAFVGAAFASSVFAPVTISLFSSDDGDDLGSTSLLASTLATLDLAGALPTLIAAGCVAIVGWRIRGGSPAVIPGEPIARRRVGSSVSLICAAAVAWMVWLVGMELAIDDVTPRIIQNAALAPAASLAAWLLVQRMRHARTNLAGAIGGVLCGLAAVTPGCGYLDAVGSVLTGAIAGAVGAAVGYAVSARSRRATSSIASLYVIAPSIGVVLLGAFATRSGLLFTGQPEVLFSQLVSVLVVVAYATLVGLLIWLLLAVFARLRPGQRPVGGRHRDLG